MRADSTRTDSALAQSRVTNRYASITEAVQTGKLASALSEWVHEGRREGRDRGRGDGAGEGGGRTQ